VRRVHAITEGAILLALYLALMLFTLYVPIVGVVLLFVLPLPFIIFTIRHDVASAIMLLIAGSILSVLFGSVSNIFLALMSGLSGLTMGVFYKRKQTMAVLIGGSLAYTASFVVAYVGIILFLQIDIIKDFIHLSKESFEQSRSVISSLSPNVNLEQQFEQLERGLDLLHTITPTLFVLSGIIFAVLTHLVAVPILKRLKIEVSQSKPFREWRLPQSLIWYYLIVSVLIMINSDTEGFYFMAIMNLYFILQFFVLIQGYSFIYFYSYTKGLSKALPIIIVIASFLIPIFLYLVRILGIIDLSFPLREKIAKR
jgi:uncharacterized protein YybS (DUF2232 family)